MICLYGGGVEMSVAWLFEGLMEERKTTFLPAACHYLGKSVDDVKLNYSVIAQGNYLEAGGNTKRDR